MDAHMWAERNLINGCFQEEEQNEVPLLIGSKRRDSSGAGNGGNV